MGERTDRIMMLAKECSHKLANEANWHCLRAAVQELEDEIERLKGLLERALAAGEGCAVNAAEALRLFNAAIAAERQTADDGESIMFDHVYCSQCGGDFGRGYHGYSHCEDHRERPVSAEPQRPLDDEGKTT